MLTGYWRQCSQTLRHRWALPLSPKHHHPGSSIWSPEYRHEEETSGRWPTDPRSLILENPTEVSESPLSFLQNSSLLLTTASDHRDGQIHWLVEASATIDLLITSKQVETLEPRRKLGPSSCHCSFGGTNIDVEQWVAPKVQAMDL